MGNGLVLQHDDVVALVQILRRVRHQDARAALQVLRDALVEQRLAHVRVHGGDRVVHHHDVRVRVAAARQRDTRLLTARHVDAAVADLAHVAALQHLQIVLQTAHLQDLLVLLLVVRLAEQDVAAHRVVHQPRLLRRQRHRPVHHHHARVLRHLAHQRRHERRLAAAHATHHRHQRALGDARRDVLQTVVVVAPREVAVADQHRVVLRVVVLHHLLVTLDVLVRHLRARRQVLLHQ